MAGKGKKCYNDVRINGGIQGYPVRGGGVMGSMLLRDLSIYWCLLHVALIFVMLFRSRFDRKKSLILVGTGIGVLVLLNGIGLVVLGHERMGKLFLLTLSLPSLIYFWLLSKDRNGKFLLTFCLADTSCLWMMAVTNLLDTFLGGGQYVLMFVSRLLLFPLLEYLVYRYFRKPYLELQEAVDKGWGVFAGMTMLYYVLVAVVADFPTNIAERPEDAPLCILILTLMFFTYATMFTALYRQLLLNRKQQSERILSEQKHSLELQLENQQQIRKLKHDMKTHTVTLSGLLAAGKTEEAAGYLKNMEAEMEPVIQPICANMYLNAVFSHYVRKFQGLEIRLHLDIQVGEETLPYMELCRILSNGLENAWEASAELPTQEREASVQMKYSRDYLLIRIKNKCRRGLSVEKDTVLKSSKKEPGHGFGLATIQEAAAALDGDMFAYTDNGNFVLDVMVRKN